MGEKTPYLIAEILGLQEFDDQNLKALCPVHREDTPSFIYNPKMHNFHCFGCGCNVDLIDAYMMTGDTYLGAVEKLFGEAGVPYSFGERGVRVHRSYRYPREEPLGDRSKVEEYLLTRKISKETMDHCDIRQDRHGNVVFNYYDTNDVLTMVKYRPSHKIDKSKGEVKSWCQRDADTRPLLFNMNRINVSQPLAICEGELDSMAAIEAGYTNAVSVPLGSQNHHWIEENMEWLDQFDEIILCADNDPAGYRMIKDVSPRLGSWRTKVVEIPEVDPDTGRRIKDLNELLYYRGKKAVLDAILNAKESPINSVDDLSDVEDINISDIDGVYFGMEALDRELFKLFFGTLTLVTGRPGCVSGDTEFFNGFRWKRIDEYRRGEMVCQYNKDGTVSLVSPRRYHKYRCDMFVRLYSEDGRVEQMVSSDHDLIYVDNRGRIVRENVCSFMNRYDVQPFLPRKECSFDGYFIVGENNIRHDALKLIKPRNLRCEFISFGRVQKSMRHKYCFTVPSGMLVLRNNGVVNVTGNSGKTSFLYQLICNTLEQNRPAWIFSRELPDFMSKSWLNYLLAGPRNLEKFVGRSDAVYYRVRGPAKRAINDCYRGQWYVYKDGWSNDVEAIQESMEASARKHGTKLFLLDNLMMINLHGTDENKYDKQTEFINWLIQFASKFSVCVILVAHPRKIQSGTSAASAVDLYDIGGSSNLVNLAHRTLSLRRVTQAERESGNSKFARYSCVVSVTKDRMRGRAGFELGMYYDEPSRRFFTNYEEYDKRYRWDVNTYQDRLPCPQLDEEAEVLGYIERKEVS